jgi:hypothetical protein
MKEKEKKKKKGRTAKSIIIRILGNDLSCGRAKRETRKKLVTDWEFHLSYHFTEYLGTARGIS